MRILSFSLWGKDDLYNYGAVANVYEAAKHYPGWVCRFYVDPDAPALRQLSKMSCQLVIKEYEPDFRPMFWRHLAASDPKARYVVFRDCDSRVGPRDFAAVQEWIRSGKSLHVMRDADVHAQACILGGMWGIRGGVIRDIGRMIDEWYALQDRPFSKYSDMDFLKDVVWPLLKDDSIHHGKENAFAPALPFPEHAPLSNGQYYVGQVIYPPLGISSWWSRQT